MAGPDKPVIPGAVSNLLTLITMHAENTCLAGLQLLKCTSFHLEIELIKALLVIRIFTAVIKPTFFTDYTVE